MTVAALVWNFLGALSWIWALPWAARRLGFSGWRQAAIFLGVGFTPALLFHSLVQVGDPDQTLATVPVVCLLGGWVLSRLPEQGAGRIPLRWTAALAVAVGINALLFFRPLPSPANAASYRVVRWVNGITNETFDAIHELKAAGPIFLVACDPLVTWRKVAYYFPDDPMLVLEQCAEGSGNPGGVWLAHHGTTRSPLAGEDILLPADTQIVWLLPPQPQVRRELEDAISLQPLGPVFHTKLERGERFKFGGYWFKVAKE
jgi:hypothetical protein